MEMIKTMPREEAVKWAEEAVAEMLERGGASPEDEDVRALETLRIVTATPDDKTVAGIVLLIGGFICAALALATGICGFIYAPMGKVDVAQTIRPYSFGFAVFAVIQLCAVRVPWGRLFK